MTTLTLVTSNKGKLAEWRRLMPASFQLESADVELDEIQSLDIDLVVADKAQRAYEIVKKPIVVEDISAGLDRLHGLPGPFIKFFEIKLGIDALYQLALSEHEAATVICAVAYYDGTDLISVTIELHGTVVPARGDHGFGFDKVFIPAGSTKTFGEMAPAEKDLVSHRAQAIQALVQKLKTQRAQP